MPQRTRAGEDLVDQHVRRLGADAEDARNEMDHGVRALLLSGGRRELAKPFLLDRADLLTHDA